ncbi:MAG: cation:proton antiporter [Candidatus Omnitrophota bacterium]
MSLNTLFVLIIIGGWFSGKLSAKFKLPSILGMTLWGIALSYFFQDRFPASVWEISPFLRSLALIVILLRAGLGIEKDVLKKVGWVSVRMAFIPCIFEGASVVLIARYLLSFSWPEAGMLGFILAAVSPAVVVPSMLTLKEHGYGEKNQIPTLILAGASLDDVVAITLFTFFLNMYQGSNINYIYSVLSVPYAVIIGVVFGLCSGLFFAQFLKKYFYRIRATEKMLLVLGFSVLLIQIGTQLHIASLLAIMTMGFVLLEKSELVAHELASKFSKVWVFAEIILFVFIGMAVDVSTAVKGGLAGLSVVTCGIFFRSLGVLIALSGTEFHFKEKLFCVISYVPKATVQAALGAVPLMMGVEKGGVILSIAVLSICFTAPLGLLGIRYFAPKLLDIDLKAKAFPGTHTVTRIHKIDND